MAEVVVRWRVIEGESYIRAADVQRMLLAAAEIKSSTFVFPEMQSAVYTCFTEVAEDFGVGWLRFELMEVEKTQGKGWHG